MKKIQNLKIAAIAALLAALMSPVSSASAQYYNSNCSGIGGSGSCSGYSSNGFRYNSQHNRFGNSFTNRETWNYRGRRILETQTNCMGNSCYQTYRLR